MSRRREKNIYEIKDGVVYFYITNRKQEEFVVKIDEEDLDRVLSLNRKLSVHWNDHAKCYYANFNNYLGIINGKPKYETIMLQRFIMGVEKYDRIEVDHESHDKLDNRKENLRVTTTDKNSKHRKSKNSNNTSGYRNVSYNKSSKDYVVQLQDNGKNRTWRGFKTAEEANEFAIVKRKELYGEFCGNS